LEAENEHSTQHISGLKSTAASKLSQIDEASTGQSDSAFASTFGPAANKKKETYYQK
jgi:hypothetical protein